MYALERVLKDEAIAANYIKIGEAIEAVILRREAIKKLDGENLLSPLLMEDGSPCHNS